MGQASFVRGEVVNKEISDTETLRSNTLVLFCKSLLFPGDLIRSHRSRPDKTMIDDQDLGFIVNFLGIFIFALVIAYHYVAADPKYEAT
ncbi:hypothetical protein EUTSA_v10021851mg [Eutrema salsugineum]|uniref:Dolichyl-diphosphooligosaccharide--protein glycosyltransferase subunit 4 n=1 Tax=Eutrema salsugineum TaxID=72664 RepID=V4NQB2_EUTSA|nr:hypothetical protein EUTSA_v10021851mg [Eutrema salsugineum]